MGRPNVIWCLAALLAGLLLVSASGCNEFEGDVILSAQETQPAVKVEVRHAIRGRSSRLHMQITRDGTLLREVLTELPELHRAKLVRYNEWYLVLAGDYVVGGYDLSANKIAPIGSDRLPFTVHHLSGTIVDEKVFDDGDDPAPFNFTERHDPRR